MNIEIQFSVTESAAARIKKLAPDSLVRISCRSAGCSGTICGLDTEETASPEDVVEEISGIKFVVDRDTLLQLDGVTLDSEGEEGFVFMSSRSGECCKKGKCSKKG